MDDLVTAPATAIDPYATLEVPETATSTDIKSAYKRLALRHHPDKVQPSAKEAAKKTFQNIVSAYAILSDVRRRRRYDITGNTSESLDLEDDDFDWLDFFRAQWSETVTSNTVLDYKMRYQGSDVEKQDVIAAFKKWEGNMSRVFQTIELCNVLDDEQRFREWIDEEIEAERVPNYDKYRLETRNERQARRKRAEKEAREAEKRVQELDKKSRNKSNLGDLAAMIQQRQQSRATNFLDDLEAKYATNNGVPQSGKGKKRKMEELPEEAFQKTAKRVGKAGKRSRGSARKASPFTVDDDEDEVVDLELESAGSDEDEDVDAMAMKNGKSDNATKRPRRSRRKAKA